MLTSAILPMSIFVLLFMIFVPILLSYASMEFTPEGLLAALSMVLRTPEFWDCKAANEIQTRMKLVMDFYKQMQIEGNKRGKSEKVACRPTSPQRNHGKEHFSGLRQEGTQEESHQVKQVTEETAEKKLSHPPISSGKKLEDGRLQGSYIVGGSVSGLNFITFTNRTPAVYYGKTKESHRSRRCKS